MGDRMLPGDPTNPYGYVEDREVLDLHREILADNGLTWQVEGPPLPVVEERHRQQMLEFVEKRNAEHGLWGFKEPQACLFLENWKEAMPEAKILMVYRNPIDVCRSLHRRHMKFGAQGKVQHLQNHRFWEVPDLALKMWLTHNRALLKFARACREDVLAVSMGMLYEGFPLIETLNEQWKLNLHEVPTSGVFDAGVTIRDSESHSVSNRDIIDETIEVWEELEELAGRTRKLTGMLGVTEHLKKDGFYVPCDVPRDAYSRQVKYEFLSFKADFLEKRLKELEHSRKELEEQLEHARKHYVAPKRMAELENTERDLRLILSSMAHSKFAPIFRLKQGFRNLERKYLK